MTESSLLGRRRIDLGGRSEEVAVIYLKNKGFQILSRNWRNRYGELDIVCVKDGNVVVVEVRSRLVGKSDCDSDVGAGLVSQFVSPLKLRHIRSAALAWSRQKGYDEESFTILLLVVTWYNARRFKVEEVPVW